MTCFDFVQPQTSRIRILPKPFLLISGTILSIFITSSNITPLIFIALVFFALKSIEASIQALAISFLLIFLNPGIFPASSFTSPLYWLVFITAFVRVLWDAWLSKVVRIPDAVAIVCLFSFVVSALSIASSYQPFISILKVISFTIGVITVIIGFKATSHLKDYWISWFITFFLVIVIAGLPLTFSHIGYLRNGRGFQGILNHPQAYGVFVAPLTALFTGLCLFENVSVVLLLGAALGWFSIFASQARTALIAITVGFCITLIITFFIKSSALNQLLKQTLFNSKFAIVFCFALIILATQWPTIQPEISRFLFQFLHKSAEDTTFQEGFEKSRGFLINLSMENFKKHPAMGIGFGVPSDFYSYYQPQKSSILGIPTGAATEKGFLPSAVLEEIGIVGTGMFLLLLNSLVKPVLRNIDLPLLWMFITCLMVNIGEMIFFSFGGMGLYVWLLIGLCYSASSSKSQLKYLNEANQLVKKQ